MPFVYGFLRKARRHGWRPGRPDVGLPGEEEDQTPGWGLPEGEGPEVEPPDIPDPPGIWPPLEGPDFPIFPVPPGGEGPWEPGEVWPPIRPPGGGERPERPSAPPGQPGQPLPKRLFFAACRIPEYGWRWVVVDLNAIHRPDWPAGGIGGRPPQTRPPG